RILLEHVAQRGERRRVLLLPALDRPQVVAGGEAGAAVVAREVLELGERGLGLAAERARGGAIHAHLVRRLVTQALRVERLGRGVAPGLERAIAARPRALR